MATPNILALDPALKMGFAHTDGTWGSVELLASQHAGAPLVQLLTFIRGFTASHKTDLIAYEVASFGANNRTTGARHEQLRGAVLLAAAELGIAVLAIHPASIKAMAKISPIKGKRGERRSTEVKTALVCCAAKNLLGIDTNGDGDAADALFCLEVARQAVLRGETLRAAKKGKARRGPKRKDSQGKMF